MSLILNGTDGLSDVDGTAATPAIRGTDANTGIFFPAADTIAFAEGGTESARFDSSGNLGVGTTSIGSRLDARTSGATVANFQSTNANGGYMTYVGGSTTYIGATLAFLGTGTSSDFGIVGTGSNNMMFGTASAERMRIDSTGRVFIGATGGVAAKLYVNAVGSNSAVRADADTATQVSIYGVHSANSGTAYTAYLLNSAAGNGQYLTNTGSWQALSDARLKTDIKNLDSTSRLMQLRPVDYLWKSQETAEESEEKNKRNFGFIAQEVKEVFPELVTVSPDGMFGVEYTGLISPLVKAIQELKSELDNVKAELATLKAQP